MIKNITIQNFKCFSTNREIELSNLTVCVGMNSVGKSTLIQALLLIRQSFECINKYKQTTINEFAISLNEVYELQLGDVDQIMSSTDTNTISIQVDDILFEFRSSNNKTLLTLNTNIKYDELIPYESIFFDTFYYLNSERLGPRNYQKMSSDLKKSCGVHGEFTFDVISNNALKPISEKRCFKLNSDKKINNLEKQIEYWLDYIIPGIEFTVSKELALRLSQLKIRQSIFDTDFRSPNNFGFGISYVLPIIVTGLIAEPGAMVIIENPEAHLHPSGQSRIGHFLSEMSRDNLQIIIETHSEHVVNGIRINSLKEENDPDNICINYFIINDKGHEVNRIRLNQRMDITEWPAGFFDQEEIDLRELRYLRRNQ